MKIVFKNLGRDKWNGEVQIPDNSTPDDIMDKALKEASKRLATRFPDVSYNYEKKTGTIEAGYRTVGEFLVV